MARKEVICVYYFFFSILVLKEKFQSKIKKNEYVFLPSHFQGFVFPIIYCYCMFSILHCQVTVISVTKDFPGPEICHLCKKKKWCQLA